MEGEITRKIVNRGDGITIKDYAKILQSQGYKIKQNELYEWMRRHGFINGNNIPNQKYLLKGIISSRESQYKLKYTYGSSIYALVTEKGQQYIKDMLAIELEM